MKIKDMFAKPIDRNIEGVIKVEDEEKADIQQELEEYVVTKELNKHFSEFFDIYKEGIDGYTKENGVWISGFFGSGKSHFLKMLSYLLSDKNINNKSAIDYFREDDKIKDSLVLANIQKAADTPTDVILFNIDAKADQTGKNAPLVNVFFKVFNEMRGYYGNFPQIARLEEYLDDHELFEDFKNKFYEITGEPWEQGRTAFDFIQDSVIDTLVSIGAMSKETAQNWCNSFNQTYLISIEDFAKKVNDYIKNKGNNHHVVFLVDEVGQFIGNNPELMLNLQTIQEQLAIQTKGKAWIIVTSQEDVDSITKVKGNDFSKIQGRFNTRLSLTSSNVDEVIRERILKKNETGTATLKALYENKETDIKNEIRFDDTPEMKLYSNAEEFASVYPFVPYQFKLLSSILTSIRKHGASGKHLSEGERSLLALFKESAESIKENEEGTLVPLYKFYDALESFVDSSHSRVINNALRNKNINPSEEEDNFVVNVLKTLFLIKYVKEIENSTLDNITSLMVSNVNEDRLALRKKVEEALKILMKEMLIQKYQNKYIFLTEEEQEISREIDRIEVYPGEITEDILDYICNSNYFPDRFKSSYLNGRYIYPISRSVDDKSRGQRNLLTIKAITPYADNYNESNLRISTSQEPSVILMLPDNNTDYIDDFSEYKKLTKFINQNSSNKNEQYSEIITKKKREREELNNSAKNSLDEALKNSKVFVNGSEIVNIGGDINTKINNGLESLINSVYNKLYFINKSFSKEDIISLLEEKNSQLTIDDDSLQPNRLAIQEILNFIDSKTTKQEKISLRTIEDQFLNAPYGFNREDIAWILAYLFKNEKINLYLNRERISLINKTPLEFYNYLTKQNYFDDILINSRESINPNLIKTARYLMRELFHNSVNDLNEEELQNRFLKKIKKEEETLRELQVIINSKKFYPGSSEVRFGLDLINLVQNQDSPESFYENLKKYEKDWENFSDNIEYVKSFYNKNNTQKEIFDQAINCIDVYESNEKFIDDNELKEIVNNILEILNQKEPYSNIPKLPKLRENFNSYYYKNFKKNLEKTIKQIERDREQINELLIKGNLEDKFHESFNSEFNKLIKEAKDSHDISKLDGFERESQRLRSNQINLIDNALIPKVTDQPPKKVIRKNLALNQLIKRNNWIINNEDDIEKLVLSIKQALIKQLNSNKETKLDVEI